MSASIIKSKVLNLVIRVYRMAPSTLKRRVHSLYNALIVPDDKDFESNKYANLSFLEEGMKDRPSSIDNNQHENFVKRLFGSYRRAKDIQKDVPFPYQPGGDWEEPIRTRRVEYLEALSCDDTSKLGNLLRNFFRNSAMVMLSGDYDSNIASDDIAKKKAFILTMLKSYEIWKDFVGGDLKDVSAPLIGNPWGYCIEGNLILRNSFRHHHFATLVKNLLTDTDNPVVAEIGGGYGGFAYYLLKERDDLTYINFDLPEILLICSYYLMNAFPEKRILLFGESRLERISPDAMNSYDIIMLPNFELPKLASNSLDLFISTASLSEMDLVTIEEYISQIARTCKRYFFHESTEKERVRSRGHIEVLASQFPIPDNFKRIYKYPALLTLGNRGEYLYERINKVNP